MINKILRLDSIKKTDPGIGSSLRIREISKKDIAVIGIACRFPGANNIYEYWNMLANGRNCTGSFPEVRKPDTEKLLKLDSWENIEYFDGAYLDNIDKFDYRLFSLTYREACLMDPNQRLFLETAWSAIEDSGYGGGKLSGCKVGVFVGLSDDFTADYRSLIQEHDRSLLELSVPGNIKSIIASRISYFLNLRGPSMVIDAACASSLVAVHMACRSIRNMESEMAICGAVKINLLPVRENGHRGIGIASSDGKTRAFDDLSDGTGFGEGVAAIVLKPISRAIEDNDNIYAIIKGSAINQDGKTMGITAPNPEAQENVITEAWLDAGIKPETIGYIEAHGTGTKLGDPVEIEAIRSAFSKYTKRRQFCAIGSVKTNIGHLDSAAGMAGLIKAILALWNKKLPPTLGFMKPNKRIGFDNSPVYVNDKLTEWKACNNPRRCGISSFGLSGTNCHVILEEADIESKDKEDNNEVNIFTISASSRKGINRLIAAYRQFFDETADLSLADICYTVNTGRSHHVYRLCMIAENTSDLRNKLDEILDNGIADCLCEDIYFGRHEVLSDNKSPKYEWNITVDEKRLLSMDAGEFISQFMSGKKDLNKEVLSSLCRLYIQGADINWSGLYAAQERHKVSLPVYPFENTRCWVDGLDYIDGKDQLYWSVRWENEELKPATAKCPENDYVLVIKDEIGIGDRLCRCLKEDSFNVIEVGQGTGFLKIDDHRYEIGKQQEHYENLIEDLKNRDLGTIIYLLALTGLDEICSPDELNETQKKGIHCFYYLLCAIHKYYGKHNIRIFVINDFVNEVNGKERVLKPHNAPLFGFAKVVNHEFENIECRCVDIDEHDNAKNVINEMKAESSAFISAYRNDKRYVEMVSGMDQYELDGQEPDIKRKGSYIITGGTGEIGLEICRYLASRNKVRLALINRSSMPAREKWEEILTGNEDEILCSKLKSIIDIEKSGSEITCYSADVSDIRQMAIVTDDVRQRAGRINGIIHCAGISGYGLIINKDIREINNVLLPKVNGMWVLDKVTEADNLDFLIAFSSLASVVGAHGQSDYAAANSYIDAFCVYRNKKGKRTLAINWPFWIDTGMGKGYSLDAMSGIMKPINAKAAIQVFDDIQGRNPGRIIIGSIDYDKLHNCSRKLGIGLSKNITGFMIHGRPYNNYLSKTEIGNEDYAPTATKLLINYSEVEIEITRAWADVLGFEEINRGDCFRDIGGDSIQAMNLLNRINQVYPDVIDISDIYTYSTIGEMSKYIVNKLIEKNNETGGIENDNIMLLLANGDITIHEANMLMKKNIKTWEV